MSIQYKHRKPKTAAEVIKETLRQNKLTSKAKKYSLIPMWNEIVGDEIARIAYPEKIIKDNILVVKVVDSVWTQELTFKKQEILDQLQKINEGTYIEDLRFVASNPKDLK